MKKYLTNLFSILWYHSSLTRYAKIPFILIFLSLFFFTSLYADWEVTRIVNPEGCEIIKRVNGVQTPLIKGDVLKDTNLVYIQGTGHAWVALQKVGSATNIITLIKKNDIPLSEWHVKIDTVTNTNWKQSYGDGKMTVIQGSGSERLGAITPFAYILAAGTLPPGQEIKFKSTHSSFKGTSIINSMSSFLPLMARARVGTDTSTFIMVPPGKHFKYDEYGNHQSCAGFVWSNVDHQAVSPGEAKSLDFYLRNSGDISDIFWCDFFGTNQWTIVPSSFQVGLNPGKDTLINCTVFVPDTATSGNEIIFNAIPQSDWTQSGSDMVYLSIFKSMPPHIDSVSPSMGLRGMVMELSIYGSNFEYGSTVMFDNPSGITVDSTIFIYPTELKAYINIASDAPLCHRDVVVINNDETTDTLVSGFTINAPPPNIVHVVPQSGSLGQNLDLTIHGENFDIGTTVSFFPMDELMRDQKTPPCGNTVHQYFLDQVSKGKCHCGCHNLTKRERCYIGTCFKETGHVGQHQYNWSVCQDPAHPPIVATIPYCKTKADRERRDADYDSLENERKKASNVLSGITVGVKNFIGTNELLVSVSIAAGTYLGPRDIIVTNPYGETYILSGGFTVIPVTLSLKIFDGWNMLSVPFTVTDYRKTAIFPTGKSDAFTYKGSYVICDTLDNGNGYWVKFSDAQSVAITGSPIEEDSIDVSPGWNMIGSITYPVDIGNIIENPNGIVISNYFEYNGTTYIIADSIHPGAAYWVKTNRAGKLILSSSVFGSLTKPRSRFAIDELPPPPPESEIRNPKSEIPTTFALEQNYPNPFNPLTIIRYQLPANVGQDGILTYKVTLRVYDMLGQEVVTLIDGMQDAGYKSVEWNTNNVPSGVYYYKLTAGSFVDVKKMMVIK